MKKIASILRLEAMVPLIVSVVMVVLYESGILLEGGWEEDGIAEFTFKVIMEILTICLIPLALRMFKFKLIKDGIKRNGKRSLLLWSSVRLSFLCLPMVFNTWLYYQFMSPAFGYMAIIGFLSLFFVYPSVKRCKEEML